jgi:rubrerythrin
MLDDAAERPEEHGDFVDFYAAGTPARGAFHCSGCGYGVAVHATLPRCPMCGGMTWEAVARRPVSHDRLRH